MARTTSIHSIKRTTLLLAALIIASFTVAGYASNKANDKDDKQVISQEQAIEAALDEVGVEVLGIRYDAPDTQWDVFVKVGTKAYEVEVDARNGKVVAAEEESLAEIQAELAGNLEHEGVEGDVD